MRIIEGKLEPISPHIKTSTTLNSGQSDIINMKMGSANNLDIRFVENRKMTSLVLAQDIRTSGKPVGSCKHFPGRVLIER